MSVKQLTLASALEQAGNQQLATARNTYTYSHRATIASVPRVSVSSIVSMCIELAHVKRA